MVEPQSIDSGTETSITGLTVLVPGGGRYLSYCPPSETFDAGSKPENKELEGRLKIGVEEVTDTVGGVFTEVTVVLRGGGVKGSVLEKTSGDQIEVGKGDDIKSRNAL